MTEDKYAIWREQVSSQDEYLYRKVFVNLMRKAKSALQFYAEAGEDEGERAKLVLKIIDDVILE